MKISNQIPNIQPSSPVLKQTTTETVIEKTEASPPTTPKKHTRPEPKIPIDSFKWVEHVRIHQPEKFIESITLNKEKSLTGYPDVTILPHGLSVKEYYAAEARKAEQNLE